VAARGTRATQELTRLGIAHSVLQYSRNGAGSGYGAEAAAELGLPPAQVFKTLIARVDGRLTVAVVPVAAQLSFKALAEAVGGKRAEMADKNAAERATGYVTGGISPIGQRKRLPVVIDSSAASWPVVYCSAGQRGLELELAPADLIRVTDAKVADIAGVVGVPGAGIEGRPAATPRSAGEGGRPPATPQLGS
jgi:Cys-tRNA(Pro)/Cys-tRNA(Cys) deacylase